MGVKFFNFFKSKKKKFQEQTKQEKNRLYLRKKEKKSIYGKQRLAKQKQLHINFDFRKKGLISISLFGFIAASIWIVFLFKAEYFTVKQITLHSTDSLTDINVAYNSIDSFRNTNIFRITTQNVLQRLQTYQPNIESISLEKQLPDSLDIIIESSPIMMYAIFNDKFYAVSQNGVAIKQKEIPSETNMNSIEIMQDKKTSALNINYTYILETESILKITSLLRNFQDNLIDFTSERIQYYTKESELHIHLENKTLLIFDTNGDIAEQVKKLLVFYKETQKLKHIYVDLRISNKVFHCDYTTEYQCRQNLKKLYTKK